MKRMYSFAFTMILLVSLIGCSDSQSKTAMQKKEFNLNDYKANVSDCRTNLMNNIVPLGNMAVFEFSFISALGSISDDTADRAFVNLSKDSNVTREMIESTHTTIKEQYKVILTTEIDGKEAEEIETALRSLYDSYSSLHDSVVNPSGSISDFRNTISDALDSITASNDTLGLFLD